MCRLRNIFYYKLFWDCYHHWILSRLLELHLICFFLLLLLPKITSMCWSGWRCVRCDHDNILTHLLLSITISPQHAKLLQNYSYVKLSNNANCFLAWMQIIQINVHYVTTWCVTSNSTNELIILRMLYLTFMLASILITFLINQLVKYYGQKYDLGFYFTFN